MKKILALLLTLGLVLTTFTGIVYAEEEKDEFAELEQQFSDENDESVYVSAVTSPTEILDLLSEDIPASSSGTITQKWSGSLTPEKVIVDQEGWLFFYIGGDSEYAEVTLYTNSALTAKVGSEKTYHNNNSTVGFYVKAGTYYYVISRWNGYEPMNLTAYAAFMPSTARIKVDKITYSKDKSKAAVTFTYDKDYAPDFNVGKIRVIPGAAKYTDVLNGNVWQTSNNNNALNKNIFYATKNGKYSVWIASDIDKYYCQVVFEIDGLKDGTLKAPKIATPKVGATTVTGTGAAYTTVNVKVSNKTYKATVDKEGKWSVKTPKLKKGDKITAYLKNTAGSSSKTTIVTVK